MSGILQMAEDFTLALQNYEDTLTTAVERDGEFGPETLAAKDALCRCVGLLAKTTATSSEENEAKMQILQRPEARQFFEEDAYEELMWGLYVERLFLAF